MRTAFFQPAGSDYHVSRKPSGRLKVSGCSVHTVRVEEPVGR